MTDIGDMGTYISNDIDTSYTSIFESDGIETVIRDSVIGGSRSALFNDGWRFYKTSDKESDFSSVNEDDSSWQKVRLPHDFQIEQSGNMRSRYTMLKDLMGWYRKSFTLPEELCGKHISIRFDGIYQDSKVYINGQALPEFGEENSAYSGTHYYGYKTFEVDLSSYLNFGDTPNIIAVSCKDFHSSSRWYTGGGINRNVWITVSDNVYIPLHGTYVSYDLSKDYYSAVVNAKTEVINDTEEKAEVTIHHRLYNNGQILDGLKIDDISAVISPGDTAKLSACFTINNPVLWGLSWDENGSLYSLHTEVIVNGNVTDTYISEFGIRDIQWDPETGVYLNGEHIKLQGVCQHENLGSLGSANNAAALERQVVILKKMGVNAIRTAHNICTPELITICNRLGMLVLEEVFDAWDDTKDGKYSLGGQSLFLNSYESDIRSMIRRDRNAPCVFMWSIGNEILQTVWGSMDESWYKIENMLNWIHEEDAKGKRYVTLAQMQWTTDFSQKISNKLCQYMYDNFGDYGVMGQNYREYYMEKTHELYPCRKFVSTESSSETRSRGVYHEGFYVYAHDDQQVSSLGNAGPAYFISAEDLYKFDTNRDWYAGQFIWSGFDYIGEPTPYDTKNSYFGIIDTAGLPKDAYYFYKSAWNKDEHTVHIFPSLDKNNGDRITVYVYSDAEAVDLYYIPKLGSSYKPQHLTDTIKWNNSYNEKWSTSNKPSYKDKLHFEFDMVYHPGTIYAVASYPDGHKAYTCLSTPDDASQIRLRADRNKIAADGMDMTFVEINACDADGNIVSFDSDRVRVEVSGAAELVSTDSGNSVDYDTYQSQTRRLFNGKAVAYIRSNGEVGDIHITVSGINMKSETITISASPIDAVTNNPVTSTYERADSTLDMSIPIGSTIYARKLEITPKNGSNTTLTKDNPAAVFNYRLLPENTNTDGTLNFSVIGTNGYVRVNNAGITVDEERKTITVTGLKPGTFRIYGTFTNGWKNPQLLSTYTLINESSFSDDPSLINDAYSNISAIKLDPSSNNQSYTIDYDNGVITGIYRSDDTLVYKDVEFGTDYSRNLILNCYNTGSEAFLEIYIDDELINTIVIPANESAIYSRHVYSLHGITGTHNITFRNKVQGSRLSIKSFCFTGSETDPYNAYERIEGENFDYYTCAEHVPTVEEYTDSNGEVHHTLNIVDNSAVYYKGIDLGEQGSDLLEICMKRTDDSGNIAVTIGDLNSGDAKEQYPDWGSLPSYKNGEYTVYRFKLDKVYTGIQDVSLFAYPGDVTYIDWFRFVDPHGMLINNTSFDNDDGYTV